MSDELLIAVVVVIVVHDVIADDYEVSRPVLVPLLLTAAGLLSVGTRRRQGTRARLLTGTHPCPGCLRITSRPGRCIGCGGGTTTQRGYGADWQRRRARQLRQHPKCEWARTAGFPTCGRLATDVDHILPKVRGRSDDPANLQSLCAAHHREKTSRLDREVGYPRHPGASPS